jgi:orotate phosphoribosyltransferase-like protein
MNKITNLHKYAILWLNSQNLSIESIAKELKLTEKQIQSVLNKHITSSTVGNKTEPVKSKIKDLMITDSASAKHKVTIMTKAASEVADESKKTNMFNPSNKSYIFKPSN